MVGRFKHRCTIRHKEHIPPKTTTDDFWDRCRYRWFSWTLLLESNPLSSRYFRSERSMYNEKKRHYYSKNFFTIHPLSRMAAYHDTLRCLFYFVAIAVKCVDVTFIQRLLLSTNTYPTFTVLVNLIDTISWLNVLVLMFRGHIHQDRIVIEFRRIVRLNATSVVFWAEILSSAPKYFVCSKKICSESIWVVFNALSALKLLLVFQLLTLIGRNLEYQGVKTKLAVFLIQLAYAVLALNHILACVVFAVPMYRSYFTGQLHKDAWVLENNLLEKPLYTQYFFSFFKASSQMFGVEISAYKSYITWESTLINMFNYTVGKTIHIVICVTLLHTLHNRNIQEMKYQQMIGQLSNWMKNKELPTKIQQRVIDYHDYYYRKRYFNQIDINRLLSTSLKLKITENTLRVLRETNVTIFGKLTDEAIQPILQNFILEVYCPNDVVVSCGTRGRFLYFLASGTVAVYTYSGKEVCHLQDGAYFGELSLLLKETHVTATITAIEMSKIYKLKKEHFERFILSNRDIYDVLIQEAEARLSQILTVEEAYQKLLFTKLYSRNDLIQENIS
ncbi:hypothetical protein GWI33_010164 [Rhynchophorus ferrugineus]|uniref:Cyclic nucleotide-binding domain-containing protein n=1 Tax=Rhynchophorus ferrugineus TaxID=354439 RepID=A0A834M996_RHYFE|nr:hypothetical protein GWI33_010164 [Rhynchophorus ferrugineus]